MRIDTYMKAVFTIIALALTAIAIRPWIEPDTVAHAQPPAPDRIRFTATPVGYSFFDNSTGDLWEYSGTALHAKFKLTKPGLPMIKEGK